MLKLHAPYLAAYDPSASVIAIASPPTQSVLLYDLRNYDKPPFATFDLQPIEARYPKTTQGRGWTKLEFSNDGKHLLVGTNGPGHYVMDAFEDRIVHYCTKGDMWSSGRKAPGDFGSDQPAGQGDVCFTPDGRYLIGGSGEDGMLVWDVHSTPAADNILRPQTELPGPGKAAIVGYNHRSNLIASADSNLTFWLPDSDAV
jgi:COMPASS component SWD2